MTKTNFKKIISDLRAVGMKDADIARVSKTTRQYIGQIGSGEVNRVNYEIGRRLVQLHGASK